MKYAVLVGDGIADEALETLGNRSPLEVAHTPHLDRLAAEGRTGFVQTIPPGFPSSSEVANAVILGVDPTTCPISRGPLEAEGMGLSLSSKQIALSVNLVSLYADSQKLIMADHTGGLLEPDAGRPFLDAIAQDALDSDFHLHAGRGYRGSLLWDGGPGGLELTPPHTILNREVTHYLPRGEEARRLIGLMNSTQMVLADHPLNRARKEKGLRPVNSLWFWGAGEALNLRAFSERFGLKGGLLSTSHALRGLGRLLGLEDLGSPDGNGVSAPKLRAERAARFLEEGDLVCIYADSADEAFHKGDAKEKIRAIEEFNALVGAVVERLEGVWDFRVLALSDCHTTVHEGAHTSAPVPLALFGEGVKKDRGKTFDEHLLVRGSLQVTDGHRLMDLLLKGTPS